MDGPNRFAVHGALIGVGMLGAVSDALLNQSARTNRFARLLSAYARWLAVATPPGLLPRWNYFGFGAAVVLFPPVNSIGALVLDFALFSGRFTVWTSIGILFAIAAIVCIEMGRENAP